MPQLRNKHIENSPDGQDYTIFVDLNSLCVYFLVAILTSFTRNSQISAPVAPYTNMV